MRLDDNKFGIFGARRANVTGWEHESPVSRILELPKSVESSNLSLNKAVIRWMSVWESLPCQLRFRFALTLTRLACACWRGDRVTPIRPGVSWHWPRFMMAARGRMRRDRRGRVQTVRDWVVRFNAQGPDRALTGKAPGKLPAARRAPAPSLAQIVEAGPNPAIHGVVRWRMSI